MSSVLFENWSAQYAKISFYFDKGYSVMKNIAYDVILKGKDVTLKVI